MLLVVAATPREAAPLVSSLVDLSPATVHGVAVGVGSIAGIDVALATTGIGRAGCAFVLSRLLLSEPDAVLQVGVGGAFESALDVGEVALATTDTYADLGVRTDDGWIGPAQLGFPLVERDGAVHDATFPCHREATAAAASVLGVPTGPFVTLETVTSTDESASDLVARYAPLVESMEGAAVAHVCSLTDTPFVQLRAASNVVGRRDRTAWRLDDAIAAAAEAAHRVLPTIAEVTAP